MDFIKLKNLISESQLGYVKIIKFPSVSIDRLIFTKNHNSNFEYNRLPYRNIVLRNEFRSSLLGMHFFYIL